ncbi:MAG: hypoxanthine phosphoribosyltransferase [Anaerolineales bacterium]|nr:hypoxanthine phosphoribosyltransferase [Anaerolineales bacterium]
MRDLHNDIDYILIDEAKINKRIEELAREIEASYEAAGIEQITLLCLLKGGYIFMSDLSRALNIAHEIDFMSVSSYGDATQSSGIVKILLDLQQHIADKHVLIVEDIIDSGLTLKKVLEILKTREPASVKLCSLLSKPARHQVEVPIDFLGFEVPDEFVVGYGLDFAQLYRNLPYIGVLKPELFS